VRLKRAESGTAVHKRLGQSIKCKNDLVKEPVLISLRCSGIFAVMLVCF